MLRKPNYKFTRKKSDFTEYREKLSLSDRRLLFGTTDVVRRGIDFLEADVFKNILKIFYAYLKLKLNDEDLAKQDIQIVYLFMKKFIFGKQSDAESFIEYDIDELKRVFAKCYESFVQDMLNRHPLAIHVCSNTDFRELDYASVAEQQAGIVQLVSDYIDFLFLRYVSKTLSLDHPLGMAIAKNYIAKSTKNLDKQTNIDILKRGVVQRILEVKISFLNQTLKTVKKDLNAYLSDVKYMDVKTRVMQEYDTYCRNLDDLLHLKDNLSKKVRTHEDFFTQMNNLGMNWACNCAEINGGGSEYFYVYIYDLIMYKYRLLAYLLANEWRMRSKQNVLVLLSDNVSYPSGEKPFDFFTRHIASEKDINAHLVKLFGKTHQQFIKNLLAIKTRTKYIKEEVTPVFYSLVDLNFKHRPIKAATIFPISLKLKELYALYHL